MDCSITANVQFADCYQEKHDVFGVLVRLNKVVHTFVTLWIIHRHSKPGIVGSGPIWCECFSFYWSYERFHP